MKLRPKKSKEWVVYKGFCSIGSVEKSSKEHSVHGSASVSGMKPR